jgi:hypothetical protein
MWAKLDANVSYQQGLHTKSSEERPQLVPTHLDNKKSRTRFAKIIITQRTTRRFATTIHAHLNSNLDSPILTI